MASYIERGDSLFIPFRDGVSISDSQCRPRMYKSVQNFEKSFPTHNLGSKNIELVEYKEEKRGTWNTMAHRFYSTSSGKSGNVVFCSECGEPSPSSFKTPYCALCGAKMNTQ